MWVFMLTRLCPLLLTLTILCLKPNIQPVRFFAVFSGDRSTLCKTFVVYVRPMLDYCAVQIPICWYYSTNKLESVQRCFTKRLTGLRSLSCDERLTVLGLELERLELRRIYADLTMCCK